MSSSNICQSTLIHSKKSVVICDNLGLSLSFRSVKPYEELFEDGEERLSGFYVRDDEKMHIT